MIDERCFEDCGSLKKITLGEKCTMIKTGCFYGCRTLAEIQGTENLEFIGDATFGYCRCLKSFVWPEKCKVIPEDCFFDSGLEEISIPYPIDSIEAYAFRITRLKELDLSNSFNVKIKDSTVDEIDVIYPFYQDHN
jgi:hypothetical protein